jgi:hypothetical protein
MKYGYRNRTFPVAAEVVGPELERIWQASGEQKLKPVAIVEAAKSAASPLHGCFEWHDGKAAKKYRLVQARWLSRSVEVTLQPGDPPKPLFVNVIEGPRGDRDRFYQHITVLVQRQDECRSAIQILNRQMEAIKMTIEQVAGLIRRDSPEDARAARVAELSETIRTAQEIVGDLAA